MDIHLNVTYELRAEVRTKYKCRLYLCEMWRDMYCCTWQPDGGAEDQQGLDSPTEPSSALTETGHVSYGDLDFLLDNDRDCQSDAGVNIASQAVWLRLFFEVSRKMFLWCIVKA